MPIFRLNTYEREMIENLFGKDGISILYDMDGSKSVQAIQKKTKIDLEKIREVLQFCLKERLIKRVRVHPFIQPSVEISAFAKDKDLSDLIDKIARLCDGNHSLQEIAKNLKVPISLVTDFLVTLGDNVEWKKK
jgi:DNA-binding HxlR family transcriptional regulator